MRLRTGLRGAACALLLPAMLLAHAGDAVAAHDFAGTWSFEPGTVLPCAATGLLYAVGARRRRGVTRLMAFYFWCGWGVLTLALVSPLHEAGETLFAAHMIQHELLMMVAAPLLVLSRPLAAMLWGMPMAWRRGAGWLAKTPVMARTWHAATLPAVAWLLHAGALWIWHAPPLFQATLRSEWVHAAQHASFFGTALLFWWSLMDVSRRANYGASVLYVFTTGVHTSILGALLTFAPMTIYPAYGNGGAVWGLTALEDQQTGGLIMWVPAGVIYTAAGMVLFTQWLRESDAMAERRRYAS